MNHLLREEIEDLLMGELDVGRTEEARRHLAVCPDCAGEMERDRLLFEAVRDLPMPAPPAGIAEFVLANLARGRESILRRLWAAPLIRRPVFAAVAGSLCGIILMLSSQEILHRLGLLTGGVVTGGFSRFLEATKDAVQGVTAITVVMRHLLELLATLESVATAVIGSAGIPSTQSLMISLALSLATALTLGRLFGPIRRENLSHVHH